MFQIEKNSLKLDDRQTNTKLNNAMTLACFMTFLSKTGFEPFGRCRRIDGNIAPEDILTQKNTLP